MLYFWPCMDELKTLSKGVDYTAKTFAGLEEVLAQELNDLGASDVEIITRGVSFRGDDALLYKANYQLRSALRILKPIGVFEIKNEKQLYEKVQRIDWTEVFNIDQTFVVEANVYYSELTHSQFVALRTKDAIVDQFRAKMGKRPWVNTEASDIYVDVHISHDVCTISLDSSGESLHKRGYRVAADKAPISEVLAAGMILLSGWKKDCDFIDPMCGSGTIAIEAALYAMDIPAGYYRDHYAFMSWKDFNADLWEEIKTTANDSMGEFDHKIVASDRSDKAVGIAKTNIKKAGLHKDITLKVSYFDALEVEEEKGILIFNPPYGKRLEEKGELRDLYRGIGDVLKQKYSGFEAWIISPNYEAAKFVGLRPSMRIPLFNGPIEARLIKFEMYQGSKRGEASLDRRAKKYDKGESSQRTDGGRRFEKRDNRPPRSESEQADRPSGFRRKSEGDHHDKRRIESGSKFRKDSDNKRGGFDKGKPRRFERSGEERSRFRKDKERKDDQIQVWESQKEERAKRITKKDEPEEKGPPKRRKRL